MLNSASELLLHSIQENDIQSILDKRINIAKKRIAGSIEDGIKSKRTVNNIKRYHRLRDKPPDRHNRISCPSIKKSSVPCVRINRLLKRLKKTPSKNIITRREHKTVF